MDLAQSLDERDMGRILLALGRHGVLRFPDQHLDLASLKRFSEFFGEIQGNPIRDADPMREYPEIGILSNLTEDGIPTRTSGSSIYPAVQNMLLAARALGLGATKEALARHNPSTRMPCCRSATRWGGSGQFAVSRSPMSSSKIGGASLAGICG